MQGRSLRLIPSIESAVTSNASLWPYTIRWPSSTLLLRCPRYGGSPSIITPASPNSGIRLTSSNTLVFRYSGCVVTSMPGRHSAGTPHGSRGMTSVVHHSSRFPTALFGNKSQRVAAYQRATHTLPCWQRRLQMTLSPPSGSRKNVEAASSCRYDRPNVKGREHCTYFY